MSNPPSSPVKSLDTTFAILKALDSQGRMSFTELTNYLEMANSTVYDHLRTLEDNDFVVEKDGEYRIGLKFLAYGGHTRDRMDIFNVARPELNKLAKETGERVNLIVEEAGKGVIIEVVRGNEAVYQDTYAGVSLPLHATSAGKAILAHLPDNEIEEIIKDKGLTAETESTITEEKPLLDELSEIRERGYAVDLEERLEGLHCVGSPICNQQGHALGSISVSGPRSRMPEENLEEIAHEVMSVTNVVEINLQHRK